MPPDAAPAQSAHPTPTPVPRLTLPRQAAAPEPPHASTSIPSDVDLPLSLGVLRRGPGDPTYRSTPDGEIWRACLTPEGPGTVRARRAGPLVEIAAWGVGAHWLLKQAPAMIGAEDELGDFATLAAGHPLLSEAHRHHARLRLVRTGLVVQ